MTTPITVSATAPPASQLGNYVSEAVKGTTYTVQIQAPATQAEVQELRKRWGSAKS